MKRCHVRTGCVAQRYNAAQQKQNPEFNKKITCVNLSQRFVCNSDSNELINKPFKAVLFCPQIF